MRTALCCALLSLVLASCANLQPASTATPPPPVTTDPLEVHSLLDKLVKVDGPAAIARAQKQADDPKSTPAQAIYAKKRVECYTAIVAVAPTFQLLDAPSLEAPAGVLDIFEQAAESAEGLKSGPALGLPAESRALFETSCGWIKQRAEVIAIGMGLRLVNLSNGLSALVPK